jgi:hypothetical protein
MIPDAFEGAMAKLDRAVEHFDEYEIERDLFLERDPYQVEVKLDRRSGWHIARLRIREEPPPLFGVLLGELAYETISALNHLIWELAARKVGRRRVLKVKNQVQFPVCRTPAHFANVPLVKHQLVSRKALRAIERLQPYDGRLSLRRAGGHPLVLAKALADADKHRVLASSFAQIRFSEIRWEWDEWETGEGDFEQPVVGLPRPLADGAEVARIRFKEGNRKANVRANRSPEVDLLFNTDRGPIRHKHILTIPWWLQDVALVGLSSLFDQDHYQEPASGWRSWWAMTASTKRGLEKPVRPF